MRAWMICLTLAACDGAPYSNTINANTRTDAAVATEDGGRAGADAGAGSPSRAAPSDAPELPDVAIVSPRASSDGGEPLDQEVDDGRRADAGDAGDEESDAGAELEQEPVGDEENGGAGAGAGPEPTAAPSPRPCGDFQEGCPVGYPCIQPGGSCLCWSGAPPSDDDDPIPACSN